MKRYKRLGILLLVLALACAATAAVANYEEKQERIRSSEEVVLEIPGDSVTALSWEYGGEGSLSFHKGEAGWRYDADENFPVSQEKIAEVLSHFEAFSVRFIIENVEDYGQYGLDEPECTLHLTAGDAAYHIRLGDFSKMDQQRYVDIGDGNVYLVSQDPMGYVDSALSTYIDNDETTGFEAVVDIRFTGAENYTIDYIEGSSYSYSEADVYFVQENGVYKPLDRYAVAKYLNTITSLKLQDYVTYNATEEELASFGLDEPELNITVNYTYTQDEAQVPGTLVLHISRNPAELAAAQEAEANGENAEAVTKYVRIGDSKIVYTLSDVDYGILSGAGYDDLRHKEVFWGNYGDVYRMDITLEDTVHSLMAREDGEESRDWYFADDLPAQTGETDETAETEEEPEPLDLTDLQDALNALGAESFTDQQPEGREEIRLTLYLENDAFPQVEIALYRLDGSRCLAVIDGKSVSLVPRATVMELVEAVQAIVLNRTQA